jgi:hypothetical protein
MSERPTPTQPEEVIAYICEQGETGAGWIDFESYSLKELQAIKRTMEQKIAKHGNALTQQTSPLYGTPLTYREVLSKVLVSVTQAMDR